MTNDSLFIDVLAQIEREPEKWNQGDWGPTGIDCGTAYCMAGWACVLSGANKRFLSDDGTFRVFAEFPDRRERVDLAATALLGIEHAQTGEDSASGLFAGVNSLDDLYEISAREMGIAEEVLRDKVQDALR